jgi:hypothetical protein
LDDNPIRSRALVPRALSECLDGEMPFALRLVDVERRMDALRLPLSRSGEPYRRVLVHLRQGGDSVGWIALPVAPDGVVSLEGLEEAIGQPDEAPVSVSDARGEPSDDSKREHGLAPPPWLGDPRRCVVADCLLLSLGAATIAACLVDTHSIARLLLVLAAACLIPGGALLTRLPVEDVLEAFGLAVGLGFTIEATGALAMVWTGWWHPFGWGLALVAAACVMFLLDLRRNVVTVRESL